MNKLTTFYLVRHGETEYNVKGIIQGQSDSPLTRKGIDETKKLAKNLKGIKFDYIFSSDLLFFLPSLFLVRFRNLETSSLR